MSAIDTYLEDIMTAVYGEDVRQSIHDAIQQCYKDASEGIRPVITATPVDSGTRVDITVGSDTTSFVVTNGSAIQKIELTSSDGTYDTYTITDVDGNTSTIKVRNHVQDISDFKAQINAKIAELDAAKIKDDTTATDSTWSSTKIKNELDNVTFAPVFTPALPSGTNVKTGFEQKGTVDGGTYRIGNIVFVDIEVTMTTTYDHLNNYTGEFAELGAGLRPLHDYAPLSCVVTTPQEKRYLLPAFATWADEIEGYGTINVGSPNLKLTSGMKVYINGVYIAQGN